MHLQESYSIAQLIVVNVLEITLKTISTKKMIEREEYPIDGDRMLCVTRNLDRILLCG